MEQRKTEIFIQTRERIFTRHLARDLQAFCPNCGIETVFVTPENAASTTETSARMIYRRIESGSLHFVDTADGLSFICRQSLVNMDLSAEF